MSLSVPHNYEFSSDQASMELSNRGNKLSGEENPGSIRPKMMWNKSREMIKEEDHADENMNFEVFPYKI